MRPLDVLVFSALAAVPLAAQSRLAADTEVRASPPNGNVVATLSAGTSWSTGVTRGGWVLVTVQGWMESSRFAGPRDTFPVSIGGSNSLRVREEPSLNGRILGEFVGGAGLRVTERRGNWARISRDVWVPATAFVGPTVAVTPAAPPGHGSLKAEAPVLLRAAPGGTTFGELRPGAIVEPQARDRGWVKVSLEAWVAESLFVPADTAFGPTLAAADLRIDPDGHQGKVVRWEVQVMGLQTADPLRRDMALDEPFLLATGPTGEDVILYIAVPQSMLSEARAIAPMTKVLLTARIRKGRSNPTGAPILDLLSILRK